MNQHRVSIRTWQEHQKSDQNLETRAGNAQAGPVATSFDNPRPGLKLPKNKSAQLYSSMGVSFACNISLIAMSSFSAVNGF